MNYYVHPKNIESLQAIDNFISNRGIDIAIAEVENDFVPMVNWKEIELMLKEGASILLLTEREDVPKFNKVYFVKGIEDSETEGLFDTC